MRQETPYYLADVVPDPKNHDYAINIGRLSENPDIFKIWVIKLDFFIAYDASNEPIFDENIHLDLETPENIRIFQNKGLTKISTGSYQRDRTQNHSKFGCSDMGY